MQSTSAAVGWGSSLFRANDQLMNGQFLKKKKTGNEWTKKTEYF
jgi:hypothetical protein